MRSFLESDSLPELVISLVTRALPLNEDERLEYEADPESFVWEEASARESANLRRCAEQTLASLADIASARQVRCSQMGTIREGEKGGRGGWVCGCESAPNRLSMQIHAYIASARLVRVVIVGGGCDSGGGPSKHACRHGE
jgi:hypothetical protein